MYKSIEGQTDEDFEKQIIKKAEIQLLDIINNQITNIILIEDIFCNTCCVDKSELNCKGCKLGNIKIDLQKFNQKYE